METGKYFEERDGDGVGLGNDPQQPTSTAHVEAFRFSIRLAFLPLL